MSSMSNASRAETGSPDKKDRVLGRDDDRGSASAAASARSSSAIMVRDNALRTSGRLSVIRVTPASSDVSNVS